jgi:hypothetical protein
MKQCSHIPIKDRYCRKRAVVKVKNAVASLGAPEKNGPGIPSMNVKYPSALSCAIGVDTVSLNAVGGHMTDGIPPIAAPWNAKRRVQNIDPT